MGTAFTEKEIEVIKGKLKKSAMESMALYGIKKTSVDQLVKEVGISKGAFYKFYETKEMLFFEVILETHNQLYAKALDILVNRTDLEKIQRLKLAFIETFEIMKQTSMAKIMEDEMGYLCRKIPEETLHQHEINEQEVIGRLMEASGFEFLVSPKVLSAAIHILFMSSVHRKTIGEGFDESFEILVAGLCEQSIKK